MTSLKGSLYAGSNPKPVTIQYLPPMRPAGQMLVGRSIRRMLRPARSCSLVGRAIDRRRPAVLEAQPTTC